MSIPNDPSKEPYESVDPVDWQYVPRQVQRLSKLSTVAATQPSASIVPSYTQGAHSHLELRSQTSSIAYSISIDPPSTSSSSPKPRSFSPSSSGIYDEMNQGVSKAAPQMIDAALPCHDVFHPGETAKLWPMPPSLSSCYDQPRHMWVLFVSRRQRNN
jgi:hypothetical protein